MKKQYLDYPVKPYEEGTPLYSDREDEWFRDIGNVWEHYEDRIGGDEDADLEWVEAKRSPQGICEMARLFLGRPVYLPELEFPEFDLPEGIDYLSQILPDDHVISVKLAELNNLIEEFQFIVCYDHSNFRPDPETLGFK